MIRNLLLVDDQREILGRQVRLRIERNVAARLIDQTIELVPVRAVDRIR